MWNNQGGYNSYDQSTVGYVGHVPGEYMSAGGFGSPQQSQDRKVRAKVQNILPCTVAQVLNASQTDDRFFCGPVEISQITVIGVVRSVKESPTRLEYEIDDMTGPPLEVKQFVDNDDSVPAEERVQAMRENTYVRVCGHVRSFGGKRSMVAFKMMPLTDVNELTCHILEVIHSHLFLTKSQSESDLNISNDASSEMNYSMGGGKIVGLNTIQNQVYQLIKVNKTDQGASLISISKQLVGVPETALRKTIEFLGGEGHIYSTIDEYHFKATDN